MLNLRFQKEFAINLATSTTRYDVTNTHAVASVVRNDILYTRTTASDIHHNTPKSPRDTHSKDRMVSIIRTRLPPSTHLTLSRLTPGQQS